MSSSFGSTTTADEAAAHFASSIANRVILITGVTIGSLGFEAARATAKHSPRLVVLVGRSASKLDNSKAAILKESPETNVRLVTADFGSLSSVRAAAKVINDFNEPIDVLINNIGLVQDFALTTDGFDALYQTNYLSPFVFTNLIKPRLLASTSPRVVNVSSAGHQMSDLDPETYSRGKASEPYASKWTAYCASKTANLLFTLELKKRWTGVTVVSLHPGTIVTNYVTKDTATEMKEMGLGHLVDEEGQLGKTEGWKTLAEGAATHIVAAFDPALKSANGAYLVDAVVANDQVAAWARDEAKAEKLWVDTERILGEKF